MIPREADDPVAVNPLVQRLMHAYWWATRGLTFGVRALVMRDDKVFLVRHTYVRGWYLPGGGVEVGETVREALERELAEEGNIAIVGEPRLFGLYLNRRASRRDHVALFVLDDFVQHEPRGADREIAEAGFFPLAALPAGVTKGTRSRLAEVVDKVPRSQEW